MGPGGNWREWVVEDESRIEPVLTDFFAMIDGPLRQWAWPRRDVDTVLGGLTGPLAKDAQHNMHVRSLVLLALGRDAVPVARDIVAGYQPDSGDFRARSSRLHAVA